MNKIDLRQRLIDEIENHYGEEMKHKIFASDCGVSEAYISKLLNKNTDISNIRGIRELILVANELDVSIDYLLGRSDFKRCSQEALDIDAISKYLGINTSNVMALHSVYDWQLEHEQNISNQYFINTVIHIAFNIIIHTKNQLHRIPKLNNALKIIQTLSDSECLFLLYDCIVNKESPLFKGLYDALGFTIDMNTLKEMKDDVDLVLFTMSSIFNEEIKKNMEIDEIDSLYKEIKSKLHQADYHVNLSIDVENDGSLAQWWSNSKKSMQMSIETKISKLNLK